MFMFMVYKGVMRLFFNKIGNSILMCCLGWLLFMIFLMIL